MSIGRNIRTPELLLFALLAAISFLPFLGATPLFDWDEINFAESAREMIASGDYFTVQINFEPFWEKPPLFFWMQVLSMKIFGINEFAARLPNALIGIATICTLYYYGSQLKNRIFGRILAGFYIASILPHLYFKSGIIDPSFNFFIFLGLLHIIRYEIAMLPTGRKEGAERLPLIAGFWIGIATLTKGPVAVLVTLLVYFGYKLIWDRRRFPWMAILRFSGVYFLVIFSWFGSLVLFTDDGFETVRKFIVYQAELFSQPVAGHEQPFYYHFVVFVVGCFPLAAFAFRGMLLRFRPSPEQVLKNFMLIWWWVVLILFSIASTKIVHYSSLLYFPGAFLAALYFYELLRKRAKLHWDTYTLLGLGTLVFGLAAASVNVLIGNKEWLKSLVKGEYGRANLEAEVAWSGWEFLPGLVLLLAACVGIYLLIQRRFLPFLYLHVLLAPLYLNGLNALLLPRIADYSQNTAIEFYQQHAEEDAYIMVEGYKSYAHYFYGKVRPFPHPEIPPEERGAWMARGPIDKPVYLVTHIDKATAEFENVWFERFTRLYDKAGFVFYLRKPETASAP